MRIEEYPKPGYRKRKEGKTAVTFLEAWSSGYTRVRGSLVIGPLMGSPSMACVTNNGIVVGYVWGWEEAADLLVKLYGEDVLAEGWNYE